MFIAPRVWAYLIISSLFGKLQSGPHKAIRGLRFYSWTLRKHMIRVEWDFLEGTLCCFGFSKAWIIGVSSHTACKWN